MTGKITGKMLISDVVAKHPNTAEVFINHGMGCLGCAMAHMETIEQGANAHGMDLKKLLNDLNKMVEEQD